MSDLKLYLLTRTDDYDYDETVSAVVAAKDAREARKLMGGGSPGVWGPETATSEMIGKALAKTPKIVHTHYRAG